MKFIFCFLVPAMIAGSLDRQVVNFEWQRIAPISKTYSFPNDSDFNLAIHSIDGDPLYIFHCSPGFVHPDGSIENLECGLHSSQADEQDVESLLSDNPLDGSVDHSRGEVWADELWGVCADYPQWGKSRDFHLRRMKLSFKFSQVRFVTNGNENRAGIKSDSTQSSRALRSFRLSVDVTEDPDARSAVSEPTPYLSPASFRGAFYESGLRCANPETEHVVGKPDQDFLTRNGLLGPFDPIGPTSATFVLKGSSIPTKFDFANTPIPAEARRIELPIMKTDGRLAYKLECSTYNVPIGEGKIDRYGIVCGLFEQGNKINLLADGLDPYSRMDRAQILPIQLYGRCASYPEWGNIRTFRLRGFQLALRFSEPEFTSGDFADHALKRVTLDVSVKPDATADFPVAPPSKYIYWGISHSQNPCDTVIVDPRGSE